MSSKSSIGALTLALFGSEFIIGANGWSYGNCDNEYNVSSCANTTLAGSSVRWRCRGFMSCADSTVDTSTDLFCQGDRACKNVDYVNDDGDNLYSYGYRSADSMTLTDDVYYAHCYGYQSCLDIVFDQSDDVNDATAYGYQAMYGAYIDYSDEVYSNGYEGLYYATINTTSVNNDEMDIEVYGYYGSYETDVLCQDGITCNFYAYGYYATEETYLYCLGGAECNVYCGDTNGCVGMNILCYSDSTCYFNCDDATECPTESDAYSVSALAALTKEEKGDGKKRYTDEDFDQIMEQRLLKKYQRQYEFKQERLREERKYMHQQQHQQNEQVAAPVISNNNLNNVQSSIIEFGILLIGGIFVGVLAKQGYNKCVSNKDYQYQSIV